MGDIHTHISRRRIVINIFYLYAASIMKSITVGITGQQGDRSNARKLLHWLRHWYENHSGKKKLTKPSECNMHRNLIAAIYRFPLHYVEFHFYFIFFLPSRSLVNQ